MDERLRRSERRSWQEPKGEATLAHARELDRAGRGAAARVVLHRMFANRAIDSESLFLLRDLAERSGLVGRGAPNPAPRAQLDLVVRGRPLVGRLGLAEVRPTIAFVGSPQVDAARIVQNLLGLFSREPRPEGPRENTSRFSPVLARPGFVARRYHTPGMRPPRASPGRATPRREPGSCFLPGPQGDRVRCCRILGERVIEFSVPLGVPWRLAPGFAAGSLRVLNLPAAEGATKFRRKLMRSVSAFAFAVPPREAGDDTEDLDMIRRLARDLRFSAGAKLAAAPLIVLYPTAEQARRHTALGLSSEAWASAAWAVADALPEALATLLLEVGRVATGLVRPRGTG